MELNEYQEQAMTTCMESSNNFAYMMLNLVGEVGEFASKVAKAIRKEQNVINDNYLDTCGEPLTQEHVENLRQLSKEEQQAYCEQYVKKTFDEQAERTKELMKEAGDILWQLSGLCSVMGWKLEDIAQQNLDKLASRKQRNQIDGDGDNR